VGPIREEIETIIGPLLCASRHRLPLTSWCPAAEGISKPAMTRMVKLDSFLRETTRLHAFTGATLLRLALKDHTFSDGTFVPAGTMVSAPVYAHQTDADNYVDPLTFDPWRFVPRKDEEGPRKAFTSTDLQFLPFGHGAYVY
jgi:cytochrome P450